MPVVHLRSVFFGARTLINAKTLFFRSHTGVGDGQDRHFSTDCKLLSEP